MSFKQKLEHRQKQVFSQGLRQTIKILELPILDLKAVVDAEIVENPVIEEVRNPLTPAISSRDKERKEDRAQENAYADEEDASANDEFTPYQKPIPGKKESLSDSLSRQLRIAAEDDGLLAAGAQLILYIDENGYLRQEAFEDEAIKAAAPERVEKALALIQSFDPAGVGARTLKECLLLQLDRTEDNPLARCLIEHHLEKLASPDKEKLARKCKCGTEELEAALKIIHALEPKPGRSFSNDEVAYIVPDIFIEEKDGTLTIAIENAALPTIRVNPTYKKMLRSKTVDETTKGFIREKIKNATNLIHAIQARRETLAKIVRLIVAIQEEAVRDGMEKLKPLISKDVALQAGVHESTISRILMNKYVQTPLGIFALKDFFSTSLKTKEGVVVSSRRIKMKIEELIEQEDKARPLRDQALAAMIGTQEKIPIARRTVAKYRESLGIPPVSKRRQR